VPDELETVLRLVAEGHLSPDEAAPIIEALTRADRAGDAEAGPEPFGFDAFGRSWDLDARVRRRLQRGADRANRRAARAHARADAAAERASRAADEAFALRRHLRIRVTERGRQVVNLRIPIGFVDTALRFVPGLAGDQAERIREAVRAGAVGPIIDVEEPDGAGGVLISVE
jgi:hypothetical protein